MPVEINEVSAKARLGPATEGTSLSEREVERIARRVIALLREESQSRRISRPETSARSVIGAGPSRQ